MGGPQSTECATKVAPQSPQSTAPATKCALRGPQSTTPATISEDERHVQKSQFTAPATKSEHAEDHHHVQSTAPATKSTHRHQTAPISCTCHDKSTLDRQNTRFPLRLPRKVITKSKNAHRTTTRAHPRQAPSRGRRFARPCAKKFAFGNLRTELFCETAQPKRTGPKSVP